MPDKPAVREEAGRWENERHRDPHGGVGGNNPRILAGRGVRLRGGEKGKGEESELKMGRLREAKARRRRKDAVEAGRGREEYKERGAGVRAG